MGDAHAARDRHRVAAKIDEQDLDLSAVVGVNGAGCIEHSKAVTCGEVFALHAKSPNQDCPIGKNIEAVLCNLQKEIDKSVGEKLGQYTLSTVIGMVEGAYV